MVEQVIHAQSTKVTYSLEMHKQGKMVRQVVHAQSPKVAYSLETHKWLDQSFMLNQQMSHTYWQCTNKMRWSDRSSINKRSRTSWKCTNKTERSFMLNQQKITYSLKMHKWRKMVRQVTQAQSRKGHIHSGNAQVRQDGHWSSIKKGHIHSGNAQTRWNGQTGHSCSINKGHIQTGNAKQDEMVR